MSLLEETLEILSSRGKTFRDVEWCGGNEFYFDWKTFEKLADFDYYNGYGSNEIPMDLVVVGNDFWLERSEYDGSEWWSFRVLPKKPETEFIPRTLRIENYEDTLAELNKFGE